MSLLRLAFRSLSVLVAMAFVVALPIAIYGASAISHLFEPSLIKNTLREAQAYDSKFGVFVHALVTVAGQALTRPESEAVPFSQLGYRDWDIVGRRLTPPEWLQAHIESAVDAGAHWVDEETALPDIVVPTRDIQQRIADPANVAAVTALLQSLPRCPADVTPTPEEFPTCLATDQRLNDIIIDVQAKALAKAQANPTFSLRIEAEQGNINPMLIQSLQRLRVIVRSARALPPYLATILALLFVLGIAFRLPTERPRRLALRWAGKWLFIGGAVLLVATLAAALALHWLLIQFGLGFIPGLTPERLQILAPVSDYLARSAAPRSIAISAVLAVAGAMTAILIRPRPRHVTEPNLQSRLHRRRNLVLR